MRISTAGNSHGDKLVGILEGFPSNVLINEEFVNNELRKRQVCYGRSERSYNENDKINIISGIKNGKTDGNPICVEIKNNIKSVSIDEPTIPRPGHADLVGTIKFDLDSTRSVIERSSARETAIYTALNAIARQLLIPLNIKIISFVTRLGESTSKNNYYNSNEIDIEFLYNSKLRAIDVETEKAFINEVDKVKLDKNSVGGEIQTIISGLPIGLGSYTTSSEKIDSILASKIIAVQSVKGISFGRNLFKKNIYGKDYQDSPYYDGLVLKHYSNNAGGIEGGMTNGEDIIIDVVLKPIPTLLNPLSSIDILNKKRVSSIYERSDITQIPAACTVIENVCAFVIANEITKKFGGDNFQQILDNINNFGR